MYALAEISSAVRARRSDMGLTQERVANLSGLSRSTVNQLENGTIGDLSLTRATQLLAVLGLAVRISPPRPTSRKREGKTPALDLAARTASVSYRENIHANDLRQAFLTGTYPQEFSSHVRTFLDEASVSLLADVIEQLHDETGVDRVQMWRRMRHMARNMKTVRDIWL